MNLIPKQTIPYVIGILVIVFSLVLLIHSFDVANENTTTYLEGQRIDHSAEIIAQGMMPSTSKKPVVKESIFHMKSGDYSQFDYTSLVKAESWDAKEIPKENYSYAGDIDGAKVGVNKLRLKVWDNNGNFQYFDIVVIVEGKLSHELIINYEKGVIKK